MLKQSIVNVKLFISNKKQRLNAIENKYNCYSSRKTLIESEIPSSRKIGELL
jgi:hypothetical protein